MFRHSCGKCHFRNLHRPSDITLADFWGWEKVVPGFADDDKGCNLVLVNTEAGRTLWDSAKPKLNIVPVNLQNCLQPNLRGVQFINPVRMEFEEDYARKGFAYVRYKYGDVSVKFKTKRLLRQMLDKIRRITKMK